ncbi:MAG: phenylalanine--tRNA ligase subunit alpha [Ignavibacterium sp.]
MIEKIKNVRDSFDKDTKQITDLKQLEEVRIKYLSRNGLVVNLFDELKNISKEEKPIIGKDLNNLKDYVQEKFKSLKLELEKKSETESKKIDLSLPGKKFHLGSKHLISQTLEEINTIFKNMGFSVFEGPEIESDYYNFEALNFPVDHPARDMQDTFFINEKFLLRTHTTPIQVRLMEKFQPPIRTIMPGRVFRNEAISTRSYCLFHQVDGIYIDKDVTFSELKGTLVAFAKEYYGENLKYRFRASFFPFTEPSAEMDITCFICNGKGCRVCKNTGWLEILGCGMIDPNVFQKVGYDSENITGYAFGMGIERITMLRYGINDIRLLFDNDVRFLKQF